jgi:outer membrane protein assembly factor BamA
VPRGNTQYHKSDMKEQYYDTPDKSLNPGPTFQAGYGAGPEWIAQIGPLELDLSFPIVHHAGDRYQKFQFQIGTSF